MSNSLSQEIYELKDNLKNIIRKYQQLLDCKNSDPKFKELYDKSIEIMIKYIDETSNKEEILDAFVDSLNFLNFLLGVDENYQITSDILREIDLKVYSKQILDNLEHVIEYCKDLEIEIPVTLRKERKNNTKKTKRVTFRNNT